MPEMVFLLGRMGNNKQALMLIIERLGDVQRVSTETELSSISRPSTLPKNKPMKTSGRICYSTRRRGQVRLKVGLADDKISSAHFSNTSQRRSTPSG